MTWLDVISIVSGIVGAILIVPVICVVIELWRRVWGYDPGDTQGGGW